MICIEFNFQSPLNYKITYNYKEYLNIHIHKVTQLNNFEKSFKLFL